MSCYLKLFQHQQKERKWQDEEDADTDAQDADDAERNHDKAI